MPTSNDGSLRSLLAHHDSTHPPVLLWKHFRTDDPRELAEATVAFYRKHRLAAAKIMPDVPLLFTEGALSSWRQVAQLRHLDTLGRVDDYVSTVRLVRDRLGPDDVLLVTVFSPLSLLGQWCGPGVFTEILQAPPAEVHAVLADLALGTSRLLRACTQAGADGVYYSCWGQDALGVERYREFGVPYDLAGLRGARAAEIRLLHLHGGRGIDIATYAGYPVHAVGWSELDTGMGLADGARLLPGKLPMGGIDERPSGAPDEVRAATANSLKLIADLLKGGFIAAPGCSLPDDVDDATLTALRDAAVGSSATEPNR